MSAPKLVSDLPEGDYEITSLVLPRSEPIGVDSNQPPSQLVRGNAPVWVWHIKREGSIPDGYRLFLVNAFPYTGERNNEVIATTEKSEDRVWYIYHYEGVYIIAEKPIWPTRAWTVAVEASGPGPKILLTSDFPEPRKEQKFRIEPVKK